MRKCCSMRVSRSSACRLLIPSCLKKSSFAPKVSRGTLKCSAARRRTSSVVSCSVGMSNYLAINSVRFAFSRQRKRLRQIRKRVRTLHKFPQALIHRRTREKLAKNIDFLPQLLVRNRLDEFLRRDHRVAVKFCGLRRGCASHLQRIAFRHNLAHQSGALCFRHVKAAPGKQQIAHNRVSHITLQPWNTAKTRNESKTKFRET